MRKLTIFLAVALGLTTHSSVAYSSQKPAARVSKVGFLLKNHASEQHKDRASHGRK
jgi:hypothetical protein